MTVTVAQLVDMGLLHSWVAWDGGLLSGEGFTSPQDRILAGEVGPGGKQVRPSEPQVTRFMATADGAFEKLLIEAFCESWALKYAPDMRLISGLDFGKETGQSDRRSMDLVVKKTVGDDGRTVCVPVIGVEAKFGAYVNGGWGYCPRHRDETNRDYSNQIICYVHGCTNSLLDESVKFIWLGLAPKSGTGPLWGRRAINDRDGERFDVARQKQEDAEQHWAMLHWHELRQKIEGANLGGDEVTTAILRALKM